MKQIPLKVQLDDTATFDNYFIAENSQLIAKLKGLATGESEFVFMWGPKDCGKTHLAQALCSQFNSLELSSAYLPLADDYLSPEILGGMSFMDLVCIDDLNSIEGNSEWENSLFDLYNNLKLEGKHLVVFSDKPPAQMKIKLADLKSRLSAMEVYKIESLDDDAKVELFQTRAENRGLDIPVDVIKFLTTRKSRSVSDLMDALDKIDHSSMALQRKVTIPLVKELFDL